jgi:hypothetical protein
MGFFRRLFGERTLNIRTEVTVDHERCEVPRRPIAKEIYVKTCPEMHVYKIRGRSPETKRLRTVRRVHLSSSSREEVIASCGLYDVQEIEILEQEPPTESQIRYAVSLGIALSDEYSKEDLSCLITRVINEEDRDDTTPVDYNLAKLAADHNIYLSAYSGEKRALDSLWLQFAEDERLLFFIFCTHQKYLKKRDYDLYHSPYISVYKKFVEDYRSDEQFQRSLSRYIGSDLSVYKAPNMRRNACKIATEYLLK